MSSKVNTIGPKLKAVEYSRAFAAEREAALLLVGSSQWLCDLELLVEDNWKNVRLFPEANAAIGAAENEPPALMILEPKPYNEDIFRWIDIAQQLSIPTTIVAPDDINRFEWMALARKVAPLEISSFLLSSDSKQAAVELSAYLDDSIALKRISLEDEVRKVRDAHLGFSFSNRTDGAELVRNVFDLLADSFILSTEQLTLCSVLADTFEMWKRPKDAGSPLHRSYLRIERTLEGTDGFRLLNLAIASISNYSAGTLTNESWEVALSESGLGILARRKLRSEFANVKSILELATVRTLKIA